MWSSSLCVLQQLLRPPCVRSFSRTPIQCIAVVERWWQIPLSKKGSPPRLYARRHKVYKLVENSTQFPSGKMELILTQTVPKFGGRGDTVFVKKSIGRNKLLPGGLAVYASPENKQMFADELQRLQEGKAEDRVQTRTGQQTIEFLKTHKLKIYKTQSEDFQLTKEVVCRQFYKKFGVVMPLSALSLPFEPIKEVGEYWCEITVNKLDTVRIPFSLLAYDDPSARHMKLLKAQSSQAAAEASAEMSTAPDETAAAVEENSSLKADSATPEEQTPKDSEYSITETAKQAPDAQFSEKPNKPGPE